MDEWIKHEDRAPEDGQAVIYFMEYIGTWRGQFFKGKYGGTYESEGGFIDNNNVLWMPDREGPLPEDPMPHKILPQ